MYNTAKCMQIQQKCIQSFYLYVFEQNIDNYPLEIEMMTQKNSHVNCRQSLLHSMVSVDPVHVCNNCTNRCSVKISHIDSLLSMKALSLYYQMETGTIHQCVLRVVASEEGSQGNKEPSSTMFYLWSVQLYLLLEVCLWKHQLNCGKHAIVTINQHCEKAKLRKTSS